MKRLLLVVIFLLIPITAWSAPFLVCDAQPNVDNYVLYKVDGTTCATADMEGKTRIETPYPLHYDLQQLPSGVFHYCIAAENVWGESAYVPFGSTKTVPGAPANTRLSNQ